MMMICIHTCDFCTLDGVDVIYLVRDGSIVWGGGYFIARYNNYILLNETVSFVGVLWRKKILRNSKVECMIFLRRPQQFNQKKGITRGFKPVTLMFI